MIDFIKRMNLPNKLTLLRVALVPVFCIFISIHSPWAQMLAALVFVAVFAALAAKGKGVLKLGGKQVRVLPKSFNPIVLYVVCALWLVCLLLCYVLGASFAYYCMFAAIAFELVAAVYYTFQLK